MHLRFDVNNVNEDLDNFNRRLNAAARDESEFDNDSGSDRWLIGKIPDIVARCIRYLGRNSGRTGNQQSDWNLSCHWLVAGNATGWGGGIKRSGIH